VSGCDAIWIALGPTPDLDRLQRCGRQDCADHPVQLQWVRADPGRLAAYNEQQRRYAASQQLASQYAEVPLL
jgi:hypothetical protein